MRNKVSPEEKQNDDELTKSLTLYVNKKLKKTEDAEDIFGKTVANGLRLITNIRNHEFVKLKIHELLFQTQFGTFRNNNIQSCLLYHNFKWHLIGLYQVKDKSYTEILLSPEFPNN